MTKPGGRFKILMIFLCSMLLLMETSAFAYSGMEYSISAYDVDVRINHDGSLNVTESVKYTSFGGYNNTVLLIDKREGEEVQIDNVYMLQKNGYIECNMLSAGQWDANVFTGSYSVVQEKELVRVKVYGTFSSRYGSIVMKYHVRNAVKRYGDVAEYRRNHIQKSWQGRISNINISVSLPMHTETSSIRPFLHGVLVGRKKVESRRSVSFNVPDTVPGEFVEARILFPQDVVSSTKIADENDRLQTFLDEEKEYDESDKQDLLRARENAAREAGRKALNERIKQRTRVFASVFSVLASLLGLYLLYRIQKKLHQMKKTPVPLSLKDIGKLSPAEVRLVVTGGETGARALLGSILQLSSMGYLIPGVAVKNNRQCLFFKPDPSMDDTLSDAERCLLAWVLTMLDDDGVFYPEGMSLLTNKSEGASLVKRSYDDWNYQVLKAYSSKNPIETGTYRYRKLGLAAGAVLFFVGCIIPVSLSIWAGYSMLPVGLLLFLYVLGIGKHTDYSMAHNRRWKELKKRIQTRTVTLDGLPGWMNDGLALLGYNIALGVLKELHLVRAALEKEKNGLSSLAKTDDDIFEEMIKRTVSEIDKALSSVQDL